MTGALSHRNPRSRRPLVALVLVCWLCACSASHSVDPLDSGEAVRDTGGVVDAALPSGDSGVGGSPGDAAASPSDADRRPPPAGTISSGSGTLVDFFVGVDGVYRVHADAVVLVGRDGSEIARWAGSRELTGGAFDGTYLAITDDATVTTLSTDLRVVATALLTEACASSVIISDHRFICGPANDWDRRFYVYDLVTGTRTGWSELHTYAGIPMRVVPGSDAFVTVTDELSPSDFHLYRVPASGVPEYVNESPYHGEFPVENVYAFNGSPATHVVTHEGLLLRMDLCEPGFDAVHMCFTRDGTLGTLVGSEVFVAMDTGSDGFVYGIADGTTRVLDDPWCMGGCSVQRLDVPGRRIVRQAAWTAPMTQIVALRHDPVTGGVVIGYHSTCDFGRDCRDWVVVSVALE